MIYQTNEQLQDACARWQGVLRLRDWIVSARIVASSEMSDPTSKAEIDYDLNEKTAVVKILDPKDYDWPDTQNHEVSLVHELLHLTHAGFDPLIEDNKMAEVVLEQAIRSIAVPLVQMMDAIRARPSVSTEASKTVTTDKEDETPEGLDEVESSVV